MPNWIFSAIGAFDRFNYGDVLFSAVARHMIKTHFPNAHIVYYGTRAADLTSEGGVATSALCDLYRRPVDPQAHHVVIICGGEVLAPNWGQMAEHLVPRRLSLMLKEFHSRIGFHPWSTFWQIRYGCPNRQPWTIDPRDLLAGGQETQVVYNAVGGASFASLSSGQLAWQNEALSRAAWISVRDHETANAFSARNLVQPIVVPDSAVIMRNLISNEELAQVRALIGQSTGFGDAQYLCFQIAERWARGKEALIAEQLRLAHEQTGLKVVGFSIGRAAGHDDMVAIERIQNLLPDADWFAGIYNPLTVSQIMGLIGQSACYVGSSLHGFITAFAFERPRVGLMPHLAKLTGFRDSWDVPQMPAGINLDAIAAAVQQAMNVSPVDMAERAHAAEQLYRDSFAAMAQQLRDEVMPG